MIVDVLKVLVIYMFTGVDCDEANQITALYKEGNVLF